MYMAEIVGDDRDNTLYGTGRSDTIYGNDGDDTIYGEDGNDVIYGGDGDDDIFGGSGDDILHAGSGTNQLYGERGNDIIFLGSFGILDYEKYEGDISNTANGGTGDDVFIVGYADAFVHGNDGFDVIDFSQLTDPRITRTSISLTPEQFSISFPVYTGIRILGEVSSIEGVIGSPLSDIISGDSGDNYLSGGENNYGMSDTISGREGDDLIAVSPGFHTVYGNSGNDVLAFNGNVLAFSPGAETAGWVFDLRDQGSIQDQAYGDIVAYGMENLAGSGFDDTLIGDDAANMLAGGDGNDHIEGQDGDDIIYGDAGVDMDESGWFIDESAGHSGDDTLLGGLGDDTIVPGAGNDSIDGGDGVDTVILKGNFADYDIYRDDQSRIHMIEIATGDENILEDVEFATFDDGTWNLLAGDFSTPNTPPTAIDDSFAANEDDAVVAGNLAVDDPDAGDTHNYTLDTAVAGLTLNPDGSYEFNPADSAYQHLAEGEVREIVADWTVEDSEMESDNGKLTITLTGVNDAPVATYDTASVGEDASTNGNVLTNDSDVDGDALAVTEVQGAAPGTLISGQYGTLLLEADGSWTYTANADIVDTWTPGTTGDDVFAYTTSDGLLTDTASLTITVTALDDGEVKNGGKGSSEVEGTDGDDTLTGGRGGDTIFGGDGSDVIDGGKGNDFLDGGAGIDFLDGGKGNDILFGGLGDDFLNGGKGDDVMTGGPGADTFVFDGGKQDASIDHITDFEVGIDELLIDGSIEIVGLSEVDENTVISFNNGGGVILDNVTGIDGGDLTPSAASTGEVERLALIEPGQDDFGAFDAKFSSDSMAEALMESGTLFA